MPKASKCVAAIDFGTSNSAICLINEGQTVLVPLEHGHTTMPTAIFYNAEQQITTFGRQALAQYKEGTEGRMMRSLKSLLGSDLLFETTVINGHSVDYRLIIGEFLRHLKKVAESYASHSVTQLVLGRPVHFVDDDAARDKLAQDTLAAIAKETGFKEVRFQYEPIAAALDLEAGLKKNELALVVDIGGGTSDFSVVRLGPELATKTDRSGDVLASSGIHIAGTDFDQQLNLKTVMPKLGYGTSGKDGRPIPTGLFFDLATWHKINFLYSFKEMARAEDLKFFMDDSRMHERLMTVLHGRYGHQIASQVEGAKIDAAEGGHGSVDLGFVEAGLAAEVTEHALLDATANQFDRITKSALEAVTRAGVNAEEITILYFTGGSTGIRRLREQFEQVFPKSRAVVGDKFASVVKGLGIYAAKQFKA